MSENTPPSAATLMTTHQRGCLLPPPEQLKSFMWTVSTCDAMFQRENAVLRAQVRDLTELLTAFDLCKLKDAHLKVVRDRTLRRDTALDRELLQVYRKEQQLQLQALHEALDGKLSKRSSGVGFGKAEKFPGQRIPSVEAEIKALRLRVEMLELEVANLHMQHELRSEATAWSGYSTAESEDGHTFQVDEPKYPSPSSATAAVELDAQHQAEVERLVQLEERASVGEEDAESARTIHKQQQQILELEKALATASAKNSVLQQQNRRFRQMATEFSRL
ncbi:unnamed protein product [Phytophthora fragariaefolia]|uniref:Unnamed protein product n=1 Tax=Phytophthora fragariaefolia TaxID=1490495 RepID=A0A9W6Y9H4_9STRA|nr:unnamed protein product [Phytophthora fragariaefolia]